MNKEQQIEELHDFILNNLYKGSTHLLAEKLYNAGYGNVSEYKAERELLGSQIKVLKQRLNNKYIEVDNLNRDYHNSFERLKAQEREIERLKEECEELRNEKWDAQDDLDCYYDEMPNKIKQAVKEFAGKIKDYINNKVEDEYGDMSDSVNYITIDIDEFETFIDNLLEED